MVTSFGEGLAKHSILLHALGLGGCSPGPKGFHPGEGASWLHGKLIGGNMLRRKIQGRFQCPHPYFISKLRHAEDKVDADVPHPGAAKRPESFEGAGGIVTAVHPSQQRIVEALNPHAYAVCTHMPQGRNICFPFFEDILGIHFYGEFPEVPHASTGADYLSDYPGKYVKRQHRWGAASDIKRIDFT